MKITIEIDLDGTVRSWNQIHSAINCTAGTLCDPDDTLRDGDRGYLFTHNGVDVGEFVVTNEGIGEFRLVLGAA